MAASGTVTDVATANLPITETIGRKKLNVQSRETQLQTGGSEIEAGRLFGYGNAN